jgi:hypothetical protein
MARLDNDTLQAWSYKAIRVNLETLRWQQEISLDTLELARDPVAVINHAARTLVLTLDAVVAGNDHAPRVQAKARWPANWLEAVKERWLPYRLLRFWPIRYESLEVDEPQYLVCPHLRTDGDHKHIDFLIGSYGDA